MRFKASWEPEVTSAKTGFTRHSGVGVVVQMDGKEEEGARAQERTIARLPEEGSPVWINFYERVRERVQRGREGGELDGDEVIAAWHMAAREVFGERRQAREGGGPSRPGCPGMHPSQRGAGGFRSRGSRGGH